MGRLFGSPPLSSAPFDGFDLTRGLASFLVVGRPCAYSAFLYAMSSTLCINTAVAMESTYTIWLLVSPGSIREPVVPFGQVLLDMIETSQTALVSSWTKQNAEPLSSTGVVSNLSKR